MEAASVNQTQRCVGGVGVAYDACGNLSKDAAGYSYAYDHDNRLTQVKDSGSNIKAEYAYVGAMFASRAEIRPWRNALGRRIRTIIGGVTTKYYYDGQQVLLETDDAGTDQRMFTYGNYIDEVVVVFDWTAPAAYFCGHDHLFSVCALFDYAGNVVERYEYDAYGRAHIMDASYNTRSASACNNPYTFTRRPPATTSPVATRRSPCPSSLHTTPSPAFRHRVAPWKGTPDPPFHRPTGRSAQTMSHHDRR
jgi:hypothetical protein